MAAETHPADEGEGTVVRTDVGASMQATLKRGSGTRDEDKVRIKAKGEDAQEAINEFETLLQKYEEEFSDRLRNIDPDRADGESDEEL